ncbi:hypothetical protein HN51_063414 [Arachis hypogaea]
MVNVREKDHQGNDKQHMHSAPKLAKKPVPSWLLDGFAKLEVNNQEQQSSSLNTSSSTNLMGEIRGNRETIVESVRVDPLVLEDITSATNMELRSPNFPVQMAEPKKPMKLKQKARQGNSEVIPIIGDTSRECPHCLIYYTEAQEVWKRTPINYLLPLQRMTTFREWWTQMKEKIAQQYHSEFELIILAITYWSVWKSRNLRVFEQTNNPATAVVESVVKLCNELQCHPQRSFEP